MNGTYYVIGDKVERIIFDQKGTYKLHISQGDIRYSTDEIDPTYDTGKYLQAGGNIILNVEGNPVDFRAIRSGKENGILTIISLDRAKEG
jgi:hypothetical protein